MLVLRKIVHGFGGMEVANVAPPEAPGSGEVLLRVTAAAICGTDLHIFEGGPFSRRMHPPTISGHEMSGVVEAAGPQVYRLARGRRASFGRFPMTSRIRPPR